MSIYDEEITVTMTRIEAMALLATTADFTIEEDAEAVNRKYGEEASKASLERDAGFEAFQKLGEALE